MEFLAFSSTELGIKISEIWRLPVEEMWIKQNTSILLRDEFQNHACIGGGPHFIGSGDRKNDATRRRTVVDFHFGPMGKVLTADDFHLAGNRQILEFAKMLNRRQED